MQTSTVVRMKPRENRQEPDDDAVAAAIDTGDLRQALVLCARDHGASLGRLCMAMLGSQADAEDMAQETLLEAHAHFLSWRREGSMRAWLLTIARRKCCRWLKRGAQRRAKLQLVQSSEPPSRERPSPEEQLQRQRRAKKARKAIAMLNPKQREPLLLRYVAALSFREVAQACGINEATARKRVSRAMMQLSADVAELAGDRS